MRPVKETVDYFPHKAHHGKTLFIIQNDFGNDGYAFWFKLLELLCGSRNQVIDARNPVDLEYLAAKTQVDGGLCTRILDKLAHLGSIEKDLWKSGIIYSQNLVNNLAPVYNTRKSPPPQKPVIVNDNLVSGIDNPVSATDNPNKKELSPVNDTDNPTKELKELKKSKLEESKLEEQKKRKRKEKSGVCDKSKKIQDVKSAKTQDAEEIIELWKKLIKPHGIDVSIPAHPGSQSRTKKNIVAHLTRSKFFPTATAKEQRKPTRDDLIRAVNNKAKWKEILNKDPEHIKNCGNFFGMLGQSEWEDFAREDWNPEDINQAKGQGGSYGTLPDDQIPWKEGGEMQDVNAYE